jgi:hypothetical protein
VWFLLGLLIAAPFSGDCVAHQSRAFTYLPELISGATSDEAFRDWVIDFGDSGYVVRYRIENDSVMILAVRHQKEAGF